MPKVIEAFASRADWLNWRKTGIGSSDVAAVLNISPYKKRHELFREKITNELSPEINNPAMDLGNQLEPIAREKFASFYNFEFNADETFSPVNLQHDELPYMLASLDGLSGDGLTLIEIKYQGDEMHESGVIRPHYMAQMQHQFAVSFARQGYFVSINKLKQIKYKVVHPNPDYIMNLVNECELFWADVQAGKMTSESFDPAIVAKFREYERLDTKIKELQEMQSAIKEEIFAANVEHCAGFQVTSTTRNGSVDYGAISELKGVDLELYRKPDITFKSIKRQK